MGRRQWIHTTEVEKEVEEKKKEAEEGGRSQVGRVSANVGMQQPGAVATSEKKVANCTASK